MLILFIWVLHLHWEKRDFFSRPSDWTSSEQWWNVSPAEHAVSRWTVSDFWDFLSWITEHAWRLKDQIDLQFIMSLEQRCQTHLGSWASYSQFDHTHQQHLKMFPLSYLLNHIFKEQVMINPKKNNSEIKSLLNSVTEPPYLGTVQQDSSSA